MSSFVAGVAVTLWTERVLLSAGHHLHDHQPEVHAGQWRLINPLINCAEAAKGASPKEAFLEKEVRKTIAEVKSKSPSIDQISVFYRDLNNGPTMDVDSNRQFVAASLMKVPVAIMYLRAAERDPKLMSKKLTFHPGYAMPGHVQTVDPPVPMKVGDEYTVEELIQRMLTKSDNTSAAILVNEMHETDVIRTLQEMGIPMTVVGGSDASIAVEDYASIFRILYNATFLEKGTSNYLLEILTSTQHKGSLKEAVDPNVMVAAKFGEYRIMNVQQYHECGIVYHPARPYLLCVMTRGEDVPTLSNAIRRVSATVFEFVTAASKKKK